MQKNTSATVWKVWDDDNNRDGQRPQRLTVYLLADGVRTGDPVTLNESNNWSYRIDGLQMMKHGKPIQYTWEEATPGNGYNQVGDPITVGKLTTLTNKREIEKTSIKVTKDWNDQNNAAGMRKQFRIRRMQATAFTASPSAYWQKSPASRRITSVFSRFR